MDEGQSGDSLSFEEMASPEFVIHQVGQLPPSIQHQVMRQMDGTSLVTLSSVSQEWVEAIRTANILGDKCKVFLDGTMMYIQIRRAFSKEETQVLLEVYVLPDEQGNLNKLNLNTAISPDVALLTVTEVEEGDDIRVKWRDNAVGMRSWLDRLMGMFHVSKIDALFVESDGFSPQSIIETLAEINIEKTVFGLVSSETAQLLLLAMPCVKNVAFLENPFANEQGTINQVLAVMISIKNYRSIALDGYTSKDLDLLLETNAEFITIGRNTFTSRDLNRFLKLWMKGANRRLKFMEINIGNGRDGAGVVEQDAVFRGIKAQANGDAAVTTIHVPFEKTGEIKPRNIEGGCRIMSCATCFATVVLERDQQGDFTSFIFYCHH